MVWLAVAVGGALGSMARHGVNHVTHTNPLAARLPFGTLIVNLIGCLVDMCGARTDGRRVRLGVRETAVQSFPIGIDVEAFRRLAAASVRQAATPLRATRESLGERKAREFDPTVGMLKDLVADSAFAAEPADARARVKETLALMSALSAWGEEMLRLEPATLMKVMKLGGKIQKLLRDG